MSSIKEALELLPCPFCGGEAESDSQRGYRNISTGNPEKSAAVYCTKCNADMTWCYRDTPEIEREQVMSLLIEQWNTRAALATFQPDSERREAIVFKIYSHSNNPKLWDHSNSVLARDNAYSIADLLLASGLVQENKK